MHVCTYICNVKLEEAIQSSNFQSPRHKAVLNVLYTAWWLKTEFAKTLKVVGLTNEQYNVLRILNGKHPEKMCIRDIASRMLEPSSNVPRIIDRLVAKNWVERTISNVDKRETAIALTSEGSLILKEATTRVNTIVDANVTLNPEEAETLVALLDAIRK